MAIITNEGEYIVVESVTPNSVTIRYHKDAEHRARYKAGTENKYEGTKQETESVLVDMNVLADGYKSIRDNNIISGYESILGLEKFAGATNA